MIFSFSSNVGLQAPFLVSPYFLYELEFFVFAAHSLHFAKKKTKKTHTVCPSMVGYGALLTASDLGHMPH